MTTAVQTRPAATPDRSVTAGRSGFSDLVRSEWAKLTSVRSTWVTLLVSLLLGVGLGTLISYVGGSHYASGTLRDGRSWDPVDVSFRALTVAQLALAVLGTLVVTSEYSTGMIRTSLTATPRRARFLLSKGVVFTGVALVVGEITAFSAFMLGQLVIGSNAPHTTLGAHDVLRAVIGAGLYLALVGLLAAGVGALLRNTAAAISSMVALLFVLPGLVQALPTSWRNTVTEWWPTEAGSRVYHLHGAAHTLSAWSGFGVLAAFTAMVFAAALWAIEHRDA